MIDETHSTSAVGVPQLEAQLLPDLDRVGVECNTASFLEARVQVREDDPRAVQRFPLTRIGYGHIWIYGDCICEFEAMLIEKEWTAKTNRQIERA